MPFQPRASDFFPVRGRRIARPGDHGRVDPLIVKARNEPGYREANGRCDQQNAPHLFGAGQQCRDQRQNDARRSECGQRSVQGAGTLLVQRDVEVGNPARWIQQ